MKDAAGWALPALATEQGTTTVYRVTRQRGAVRLEGVSGSRSCRFETESADASARRLLGCRPPARHSGDGLPSLARHSLGEACTT